MQAPPPHQSGVSELFLMCVIKLVLLILWFVCFVDMTNLRYLIFRIKKNCLSLLLLKEIKWMGVFYLHRCLCTTYVQCQQRSGDDVRSQGTRVADGSELVCTLVMEPSSLVRASALRYWAVSPAFGWEVLNIHQKNCFKHLTASSYHHFVLFSRMFRRCVRGVSQIISNEEKILSLSHTVAHLWSCMVCPYNQAQLLNTSLTFHELNVFIV